ncbi:MAG: ABC transporter substrate-binding protein [Nocardioidaceae bacterium]|nr:ABC transporter substrate-binding protein [Nocardioidaceae bacterium]
MKRRTLAAGVAAASMLAATTGCGAGGSGGSDSGLPSARIATVLTTTGPAAVFGQNQQKAVELAVEQLKKDGTADLDIVAKEDAGEANTSALNAYRKVLREDPDVVVGPIIGTMMLAIRQEVERARIPMLTTAATTAITENDNKYIFRNFPSSDMSVQATSAYAFDQLGVKKPAILADSTAFGQGDAKALLAAAGEKGIDVVANESVDQNAVDVTGQVARIKRAGADAVFVQLLTGSPLAVAIKGLRRAGFTGKIFAAPGITSPSTLELLTDDEVSGIYSPGVSLKQDDPKVQEFTAAYQAKYGKAPDVYTAVMYDSVMTLGKLVADGAKSADDLRKALAGLDTTGLTGRLAADKDGNLFHTVSVLQFDAHKKAAPVTTMDLEFEPGAS